MRLVDQHEIEEVFRRRRHRRRRAQTVGCSDHDIDIAKRLPVFDAVDSTSDSLHARCRDVSAQYAEAPQRRQLFELPVICSRTRRLGVTMSTRIASSTYGSAISTVVLPAPVGMVTMAGSPRADWRAGRS